MSNFITLFIHYLPDLLQGMLVTLWLTIQGLAPGEIALTPLLIPVEVYPAAVPRKVYLPMLRR